MPFWINILVGLLAFVVAALGGKALLPWLHKLKFGQPIKVDFGPSWHANKQGTPTMGGLLFIFGSIIATAVGYALYRFFGTTDFVSTFSNREALRLLSCMIFYRRLRKGCQEAERGAEAYAEDRTASGGSSAVAGGNVLAGRSGHPH